MSDYKRFVSYIYGYEQGEKRENAGFVKVNARGDECKIWVHMKGFYVHGQKPYRVYVFSRNRERLQGRLLGELENRNGALEWNCVTRTDSLAESGLALEESRGLYIEGENQVFAAEWDDYPVAVEQFETVKRSARQEMEIPVSELAEPENREMSLVAAVKEPEPVVAEELQSFDMRKEQWGYLTRHFPVMQYRDGEALICSIRLESKDLVKIPRDKWGLGNNSFLFHGFYQYHHLLLLRRQTPEAVQYLVGVPGIYNEREQLMASMFGFQEFKVMKGPDVKNGSFGYWCRTLD